MSDMAVKRKEKILVAMSGGVDSSVAVALLVKAGYDVTGAFMVNYGASSERLRPTSGASSPQLRPTSLVDSEFTGRSSDVVGTEPCWHGDYQDALRVAAKLKIPLLRLDFVKEYQKMVLDYTFKSYSAGRTPNPDILCNKFVKFGAWLEKAEQLGFDKLATGHYAKLACHCEGAKQPKQSLAAVIPAKAGIQSHGKVACKLLQSADTNKDQTYFLHQLNQKQLSKTLFPIGNYTKHQVRALAKKFNLPTADKAESMGICFVGEMPMREFLKGKVKAKPGKIISTSGELLGEHDGLPFYTIGERVAVRFPPPARGGGEGVVGSSLSLRAKRSNLSSLSFRAKPRNPLSSDTQPLFVIGKNLKNNTIIVGTNNDPALFKKQIIITNVSWIAGQMPKLPLKCKVRLRHRQELQDAIISALFKKGRAGVGSRSIVVKFTKPQRAVTPGQYAVFYLNNECLGGGEII